MSSVTALNDPERDRPHRDRRGLAAPVKAPVKAPAIPAGELVYGLVVAVDIESFSRLDTLDQSLAQERLRDVLDVAAQKSGLDRDDWYRQPRGDGELAVLPTGTDVAWVVARFTDQLADALRGLRWGPDRRDPALRLRVSMHYGTLTAGHFGPVGDAPIVACRLLDASMVRRALADEPRADLVLVTSERLFHDVVRTRFHGLVPDRFRQVRMSLKGVSYTGYVCAGTPMVPGEADAVRPMWTQGRHAG